jgi:hypothetical protein
VGLKYFVEANAEHPRILARVDGVKVANGIGPKQPVWTRINSLASLAWESSGLEVRGNPRA